MASSGQGPPRPSPLRPDAGAHPGRHAVLGERGARAELRAPAAPGLPRLRSAAARRYPWVRYWLIWNEPNQPPLAQTDEVADLRPDLLNPGYEGIHSVLPHARVGGGVTAPRGGLGGVAPVGLAPRHGRAHAKSTPMPTTVPLDAASRRRPAGGCSNCPSITMATIRRLLILVKRYFGPKPIWLTEYGYQTNPPDTFLGVPPKRQANMVSLGAMRAWRLPRVTMLFQYLYRDEAVLSRFQTGLVFANGQPSPRCKIQAAVRGDDPRRAPDGRLGTGPRRTSRTEALPAGGAPPERVEAGRARPPDERCRRLHPDDSPQARRTTPVLSPRPSGASVASSGSGGSLRGDSPRVSRSYA